MLRKREEPLLDTAEGDVQLYFCDRDGEGGRRACAKARMSEQSARFSVLLEHRFPGTEKSQELTLERKTRVL